MFYFAFKMIFLFYYSKYKAYTLWFLRSIWRIPSANLKINPTNTNSWRSTNGHWSHRLLSFVASPSPFLVIILLLYDFISFYFTILGMVKYCNRAWKKWFFCFFFSKYLKNGWNYFDKKNWVKPWRFGLQKSSNKWRSKNLHFSR